MIDECLLLSRLRNEFDKDLFSISEIEELICDIQAQKPVKPALSVPEAVLYYYILKYVDADALLNETCLTTEIDGRTHKYTADVSFRFHGQRFILEFDSLSQHRSEAAIERDIAKNKLFSEHGYTVIRLRNRTTKSTLPDLPHCVNIPCGFNYTTKPQLNKDNETLHFLMNCIGVNAPPFNYADDYELIRLQPYFPDFSRRKK